MDLEDVSAYLRCPLSVYLACSLTSADNRAVKDRVLAKTERVFAEAGFKVYNPAARTPPGSPHTPCEVYFEDLFRTISADFVFFVRLGRSHGMGIEAQLAADVLLPWADVRTDDESYSLSPLVAGLATGPGIFRATLCASTPDQFYTRLADFLRDQARMTRLFAHRALRETAHSVIREARFGRSIRIHRLIFGLSCKRLVLQRYL